MAAPRIRPTPRPRNLVPCSKQRCTGPATHQFSFDYQEMTVYLADYEGELPYGAHALCLRHAEAFTVPNGWQLEDRRRLEQPLFVQSAEANRPRREDDHPAMRAKRGLRVRRRADLPGGYVPSEDHPSGPLDVADRSEPSDITRRIERLARDLHDVASDSGTGPGTELSGAGDHADADGDAELDISDSAVGGIADGLVDYWDDDSTFGDELDEDESAVEDAESLRDPHLLP